MFLTEANVLHYLLERRFADLESVVGGAYCVRNLSRRNRNFRVTCGAREYLVKQPKKWDSPSRQSLEQEAAVYWQTKIDPSFQPLKALVPESYGYDPAHSILILEYLAERRSLHRPVHRFVPDVARLAGETMGAFHRDMRGASNPAFFRVRKPWYFTIHEMGPKAIEEQHEGQRDLVRMVQKHADFGRALDSLREEWRPETAVHGDWKLENCLASPDAERLWVVDWEFVNWGDPFEDIGTMLQSYWGFWVRWPSSYGIEGIQPALRAFLAGYADAQHRSAEELAARALRFAAARMLQTAYESLDAAKELNADAVRLSQASLNMFTRPEWALGELLGAGWN